MSRKSLLEAEAISEVLSDSNEIRTNNHLVRKGTLNHLAKLVSWLGCYLNLRYGACFDQGLPWHSGKLMWIHSETRTWHDNNIHVRRYIYNCLFYSTFFSLKKKEITTRFTALFYAKCWNSFVFCRVRVTNVRTTVC